MRYLKQGGYDVHWAGKSDCLAEEAFEDSVSRIYKVEGGGKSERVHTKGEPGYYSFLNGPTDAPPRDASCFEKAIEHVRGHKATDPPFMFFWPPVFRIRSITRRSRGTICYNPDDLPPLRPTMLEGKPDFYPFIRRYRNLENLDEQTFRKIMAVYLGMVSYVDHLVGQLLDALDETGLAEDTAIVFFSDHGDWAGDYGLVEKWPSGLDDCLTRVPLIIRAPGGTQGHVVEEQNECFDIMPKTLELAGVEARHTHFARSLVAQLHGACGDSQRVVFAEGGYDPHEPHCFEGKPEDGLYASPEAIYFPKAQQQQEQPQSVCRATMVRSGSHKLVRRTSGQHELYDLAADPLELNNLYGHAAYGTVQGALEGRMLDWYVNSADVVPQVPEPRGFPPHRVV
jgi:arylsulfatase A-like enzyme